ncbi:LysR family transcriptional regulator [Chitinibacter tainanensis]|uniref:LysR family transcriptional regulator n=1 Tax=Chitinibacter tainanensis TaxID=230667 RepID=UPI00041F29EA|nr:LysR family transcriptional regulator [Chitinibacter tainanensis]
MNEYDFPWDYVQSFLAALEQGSLMGAARASGISQPTLSRHIAELEQRWQVVLFERTGRGLVATPAALNLAPAARSMAECASQLGRLVTGAERELAGRVRLAASQTVAYLVLPALLAQLKQRYPAIEIELVVSNTQANLLRREADIALRMVRPQQSSLIARKIAEVPVRACAQTGYLAAQGRPREVADLLTHALISGDQQDQLVAAFAAAGLPTAQLRFGLRSDDLMAQWMAVRAGLGVGFLAGFLCRAAPEVEPLLPDLPLPRLPLWLTVHRELNSSARIRAVYDFLAEALPAALA